MAAAGMRSAREQRGEARGLLLLPRRREHEVVDVEQALRVDDASFDRAVLERRRRQRIRPRLAREVDRAAARVVGEDLARPLHAGQRERLRLHLVAARRDVGEPALLAGGDRHRDGRRERRDEHREDHRGAALASGASSQREQPREHEAVVEDELDPHGARQPVLAARRPSLRPASVVGERLHAERRDVIDQRVGGAARGRRGCRAAARTAPRARRRARDSRCAGPRRRARARTPALRARTRARCCRRRRPAASTRPPRAARRCAPAAAAPGAGRPRAA